MATITTSFQQPTTVVPLSFDVTLSQIEAANILAEIGPLFAANSGALKTACPNTYALFSAVQVAATQSATPSSPGASVPPTVTTVTL